MSKIITNRSLPITSRATRIKWIAILAAATAALLCFTEAFAFEVYNSSKNYCGPKLEAYGRILPNPIPNQPVPGVNFNRPCYEHDKCYAMCSSNCASKAMCDKDFKNRMENICKTKSTVARPACMNLAQTYYQAVDKAGSISYHCGTPACPDSTTTLPMGTPTSEKAFFFEHSNFSGTTIEFSKGTSIPDLTKWNTPTGQKWNDRISSLKVGSGVRVLAYEHINFGGRCITFSSNKEYPNLSVQNAQLSGTENWNDRISSLKVTEPNQVCP